VKLHLHNWTKWSLPFDAVHDYKKLQCRTCIECNKVEVKPIKQPWNQFFSASTLISVMKESTT